MKKKLEQLRAQLRANAPLAIAYSGGVDSACLLAEAHETLGADAIGDRHADAVEIDLAGRLGVPAKLPLIGAEKARDRLNKKAA